MQITPGVKRLAGQAMHDYAMLAEGDRVLVAVSGGVDSLVLAGLLHSWQKKAPVRYELIPVHIKTEYLAVESSAYDLILKELEQFFLNLHMPLHIQTAASSAEAFMQHNKKERKNNCFICSRHRRSALFSAADRLGCNKLALGHHQDDLIETFLLNLTCAGNISTMRPRQDLFQGRLALIRPLAYLDKNTVEKLAQLNGIKAIVPACTFAGHTRRDAMRKLVLEICHHIPNAKKNIFAALANVRSDYLLSPKSQGKQNETHLYPVSV